MPGLARLIAAAALLATTGCAALTSPSRPAPAPVPAEAQVKLPIRQIFLQLVEGMESEGNFHAALAYLDAFDATDPGDPRSRLLRARAELALARPGDAEAAYRTLLDTPLRAAAEDGLGQVMASRQHWAEATADFASAVALRPADATYLNNYGFSLMKQSKLGDAEFALSKAAELAPAKPEIRTNLLRCLRLEGKTGAAAALASATPHRDLAAR